MVERAILDEREMQYLYKDGDGYCFMDTSSYEQIHLSDEALGDSMNYLLPESTIQVEFYEGAPVGIELPQTVDLKVEDTAPGIKGATASAQVKPATLETGLVVNVPSFINTGDSDPREHRDGRVPLARVVVAAAAAPLTGRHGHRPPQMPTSGWIEVITGSMFSGQDGGADPPPAPRADRPAAGADLQAAHRQPLRRRPHHLAQRDAPRVGQRVELARAARAVDADTQVVGIDEGQFFDAELPAVCNTLADQGKRVIVAGLDQDYLGKPFEPMPQLLAIAEYITKTLAICVVCGAPGQPHAAPRREQRARAGGRHRRLRGALPRLLRPAAGRTRTVADCIGHASCSSGPSVLRPLIRPTSATDAPLTAAPPAVTTAAVYGPQTVRVAWTSPGCSTCSSCSARCSCARTPSSRGACCAPGGSGGRPSSRGPTPRPRYYGLNLGIGITFGVLLLLNVFVLRRSASHWFWQLMMVVYYGYLFPLSTRIRQGFYEDGVWAGPAFVPYAQIGSLTWREEPQITLLLVPRMKSIARRLVVPQQFYAQARRLLRDRIKRHDILLARPGARPARARRAGRRVRIRRSAASGGRGGSGGQRRRAGRPVPSPQH